MPAIPQTPDTARPLTSGDLVAGAVAGLICLGLYLATLQLDFGGPEDTPKFQFLGHVLGTAHPPGYPLYVWLSHLFVKVPIGSIAYRANLFSGVTAAFACSLAVLLGRQIGARRSSAFCAGLALGTGESFWRSAVFAEVYSLAALMATLTVTLVLACTARPKGTRLLSATGAFALGLGNHLTLVGIAPACLLYVIVRHRRLLTKGLVAAAFFVFLAGMSQYALIVIRTNQGAPYLESRASSIRDLPGVITAERFAGQRFAFGPWTLLTEHLPAIASVIDRELGIAGVLLLAVGLFEVLRGQNAGAALLAGAAAGMLGMVLNISGDLSGFITPVMVLVWPLVALGIDAVARTVRRLDGRPWVSGAAAVAVGAFLPLSNVTLNYGNADQSEQTGPGRFFRSAFGQLPDRAGVVVEDYYYDMALHYMLLTGEAGPQRGIARIGFDSAEVRAAARGVAVPSRRVFGFGAGSLFLGTDGLQFARTDVSGPPLADWLRTLPRNTVVVGAAAYVPLPVDLSGPEHSHARPPGRSRTFEMFVVRTGTKQAAWRGWDDGASVSVDAALLTGVPAFAGSLVATAEGTGARIELAGQQLASVETGLALAVFAPNGQFLRAEEFRGELPARVPFQEALYELAEETPCVQLTSDAWTDVSPALTTGSWIATLQAIGSLTIETAVEPPDVPVRASSTQLLGDGTTGTTIQPGNAGSGVLFATELTRRSEARPVFRLSMDRPGVRARARVRPGGATRNLTVCSHHPARPLFAPGSQTGALGADFEAEAYYGPGWSGVDRNEAGRLRRGEALATLLLPLPRGSGYKLVLDLRTTDGAGVHVSLKGRAIGTCDLRVPCELSVPRAMITEDVTAVSIQHVGSRGEGRRHVLTFRGARIWRD